MTKLMAIDYGSKRVGVASTDESGVFPIPRMVLENNDELIEKIIRFKEDHNIETIVIGESKDFSGNFNPIQQSIDEFKRELERLGFNVISHPEILTTREARQLQGTTAMTDASAAALILKNYIDSNV